MGKATLVGMTTMFLMVPFVKVIITRMMKIRRKRARFTDKRVEVTSSMLQAIRFCKLNHYEEKFIGRVRESRKNEMHWVSKELSMIGWTLTITVLTPVIASAVTFITYALIDGGRVLTSSDTFTTLLLFSVLRFPINYVGKLIGKAAQGIEACQRIADFLDRDVSDVLMSIEKSVEENEEEKKIDENEEEENDSPSFAKDVLLHVENGHFTVGGGVGGASGQHDENILHAHRDHERDQSAMLLKSEEDPPPLSKAAFTLSNIHFTVKRSEVLSIVGPVASGKVCG